MSEFDFIKSDDGLVVVTPLILEYAPAVFKLIDSNREHLSQFGDVTAKNYPNLEAMTESIVNPKNPERERFAILFRGVVAGSINITPVEDEDGAMEIGYWLGQEFTGQGIASTSAEILSDQALKRPTIDEVIAFTHPKNFASQKTLARAGFEYSGIVDNKKRYFKT